MLLQPVAGCCQAFAGRQQQQHQHLQASALLQQQRVRCRPVKHAAAAWAGPRAARRQLTVKAAAADMGSHHTPHLQQLEGHAGRAWSSIQQRLQQLVQPSQYDAELLHLAAPALAAMLLEPIMNVISAAVLGHLGTQQLGAVSLASLATSLATYIFSFLVFLTTPRIAAAHAHGDSKQVSRLAAVGLWLAAVTGTAVAIGMHAGAGWIVQALNPKEPQVFTYAVEYIKIRSWGIMAAMLGFVASGSYRGIKDTATPLKAAILAAGTNLVLTPFLIIGLNLNVYGAGLAATLSTWVSCITLIGMMLRRKVLDPADLASPPTKAEVVPYLWKGAVLAFRMIVTFGMIMFASATCVRAGAVSQAAFEIIRQAWIISIQLFESLNVAMQAMAAAYLGKHDRSSARSVLVRTLQISTALGLGLGLLLAAFSHQVVGLFTRDAAVSALACAIMPVIAFCMPLDAAASITDGGLIAAGQTNALSVIQVLGTLVQYAVMAVLMKNGMDSVVYVWAVLKVMTLARLGGGLYIHFGSRRSAFKPKGAVAASAAAPAAEAATAEAAAAGADGVPVAAVQEPEAVPVEQPLGSTSAQSTASNGSTAASTSSTSSSSSSSSSQGQRQSSSSSVGSSVLVGVQPLQQQQPLPPQAQPLQDWQQLQMLPPQQHQVFMQHQQQHQRHYTAPVGNSVVSSSLDGK